MTDEHEKFEKYVRALRAVDSGLNVWGLVIRCKSCGTRWTQDGDRPWEPCPTCEERYREAILIGFYQRKALPITFKEPRIPSDPLKENANHYRRRWGMPEIP